jgi:hypothetical protein
MENKKALRSTLIAAITSMAASLIAAPTMAELNQECLFFGSDQTTRLGQSVTDTLHKRY